MTAFSRQATHYYRDPLEEIWLHCAHRLGFRIERTADAYATSDGQGTISLAEPAAFDPDDNLGQMIFHELCHALVEGELGETRPDWGLGSSIGADPWREHACLRVQAWLAAQYGLRDFLAPTTDFRSSFWESLPSDPLWAPPERGGRRERSCVAARRALYRAAQPRWSAPLHEALAATATIAAAVPKLVTELDPAPSLWGLVTNPPAIHPAGHAVLADYHAPRTCRDCAWSFIFRDRLRCRHSPARSLPSTAPACTRFEAAADLACETCGACCREAYDSVEVGANERVHRRHPDLVSERGPRLVLHRDGGRCAALQGGTRDGEPYRCGIYADRPRSCREFTKGSGHCLEARRRVGLSL